MWTECAPCHVVQTEDIEEVADAIARSVMNVVVQIKKNSCDTRILLQGIMPRGDGRSPCQECYGRWAIPTYSPARIPFPRPRTSSPRATC